MIVVIFFNIAITVGVVYFNQEVPHLSIEKYTT
jgi:hypothetical protein